MHTLITYIRGVFFFISTVPDLIRAKRLKKKGDAGYLKYLDRQYRRAVKRIPEILGVKIVVTGSENIIGDRSAIFVSNHQSYLDPVFIFAPLGFICPVLCKKEVRKIPLVSGWLRVFDCVFIDRENARNSVKSLNEAAELVSGGKSMIIFPEGTRAAGYEPGEFKAGAFKVAEKTKATIVPVRLHNACDVMRRGSAKLNKATVRVDFLEPVDISRMSRTEIRELPEKIRALIAEGIEGENHEQ